MLGPELARYLTELSRELNRQIGLIVNRRGSVEAVIVGDHRQIVIPVLRALGRRRLRGLRCVHTHLKDEPLTQDDLTDLALLRLDVMAALGVTPEGLPGRIHLAHLLPTNPEARTYQVLPPTLFHDFDMDVKEFIEALEAEMGRAMVRQVDDSVERAILVSVATQPVGDQLDSLEELKSLALTSGVEVLDVICQRPAKLNPRYLMGTGKIKDLVISALQKGATVLIFDQELSPTQVRELGDFTELKVIDRTQLILDIFARRAHTRDGKVQVELAQLKYRLPKLSGKGTSLSRLMGGIGGRGPGESKLEVDRRRVGERIGRLEKELKALSRSRRVRRRRRAESGVPIISIVGYANAGKSTLLNALTRSSTLVEDKLFATLDTASRRLRFPRERDAVITDTVGFIKDLPAELKKAFRATIEEMEDADLLLHLVDISSPHYKEHMDIVEKLLVEFGLAEIPRMLVLNKTDLADPEAVKNLSARHNATAISATDTSTLDGLIELLGQRLWPDTTSKRTRTHPNRRWLH